MVQAGWKAGAALSVPLKHTRAQILPVRVGLKQHSSTCHKSFQKETDGETMQWLLERGREHVQASDVQQYDSGGVWGVFFPATPSQENFLISVKFLRACWQTLETLHHYITHSHTIFLAVIHTNRHVWIHPPLTSPVLLTLKLWCSWVNLFCCINMMLVLMFCFVFGFFIQLCSRKAHVRTSRLD